MSNYMLAVSPYNQGALVTSLMTIMVIKRMIRLRGKLASIYRLARYNKTDNRVFTIILDTVAIINLPRQFLATYMCVV